MQSAESNSSSVAADQQQPSVGSAASHQFQLAAAAAADGRRSVDSGGQATNHAQISSYSAGHSNHSQFTNRIASHPPGHSTYGPYAYNPCMTTNTFSNGPISSSFAANHNQASYHNKFHAYQVSSLFRPLLPPPRIDPI